jgi:thiol-disulfide isomerase/thioredoxin
MAGDSVRSRPEFEVLPVRTLLGLGLVAFCLLLAGCRLPSVRPRSDSSGAPFDPGKASPSGGGTSTTPGSSTDDSSGGVEGKVTSGNNLPPNINGFLAGQVLDAYNRRLPGARIEIVDLDDQKDKAPLTRAADPDGYFRIAGLNPGHKYLLVARYDAGSRLQEGRIRVIPPNIKVAIYADEIDGAPRAGSQGGAGDGENRPAPEKAPEKAPRSTEKGTDKSAGPAARLEAPIRTPADRALPAGEQTRGTGASVPSPVVPRADPSGKAETPSKTRREQIGKEPGAAPGGEWNRFPSRDVSIPSMPGRELPPSRTPDARPVIPPPPSQQDRSGGAQASPPSMPSASMSIPGSPPLSGQAAGRPDRFDQPARPPFCAREGRRVHNLALSDLDGETWELRRHRRGRLVLLDFWATHCPPCLNSIPHLKTLQQKYGSYGLSVVGVAYENSSLSLSQQVERIRGVQGRLNVNYLTLLGGGPNCPVKTQLEVSALPTLILLDESGTIVWRSEGLDPQKLYDLEMAVRRSLRMPLN